MECAEECEKVGQFVALSWLRCDNPGASKSVSDLANGPLHELQDLGLVKGITACNLRHS